MSASQPIRCLITAGPTREWLDPVRFVTNPSSGKMGFAIAAAARDRGWQVELVTGPVALAAPEGVDCEKVVTGDEMLAAVQRRFSQCDVLIKTAAVCDMRPKQCVDHKVKKGDMQWTVEFEPTTDILKTVAATKSDQQVVVGFAAETDDVEGYAMRKLNEKNLDFICANQVGGSNNAFEADDNTLVVIGADGSRNVLGPASKTAVGKMLIDYLAAAFST
ncbi:MAG: phosphopantothenoylcysteine decarboxylase [Verrucomicrobiota bacterium]